MFASLSSRLGNMNMQKSLFVTSRSPSAIAWFLFEQHKLFGLFMGREKKLLCFLQRDSVLGENKCVSAVFNLAQSEERSSVPVRNAQYLNYYPRRPNNSPEIPNV